MKVLLVPLLTLALAATALGQKPPKGFVIPKNTRSPDGHYGITVPISSEQSDDGKTPEPKNSLVDLKTGKALAVIDAPFTGYDHMNNGGVLPTRWTPDGSLALWQVEGKWSRFAVVALRVEGGKVVWQTDILKAAQQALLEQSRKAEPKRYAAAKKANEGSGDAYPEGFTIDARVIGKLVFPLHVRAELTSDPKGGLEPNEKLYASLEGTVDAQGKFAVTTFHVNKTSSAYNKLEEIEPLTD